MGKLQYGILIFAFLFLAACNSTTEAYPPLGIISPMPGTSSTPTRESISTVKPELTTTITPTSQLPSKPDRGTVTHMPERVTPEDFPEGTPITGEVPADLLDNILSDLAQKIGVDGTTIQVLRSEAIIWNDGSLGCPKPGEFYTQALVNGYRVVLKAGDKEYDYHAAESGYFFLCEGGFIPKSPQGTPDS